jgi:eukaryotic-like serine/threonine-protein kinase
VLTSLPDELATQPPRPGARDALMLTALGLSGWLVLALVLAGVFAAGWMLGSRHRRAPVVLPRAATRPPSNDAAGAPEVRRPEPVVGTAEPVVVPAAPAAPPAVAGAPQRSTLGRYRIEGEIGRGSMGAVYLGHDPHLGRNVAIKTMALSREFAGDELTEARERFFREAEMAGRLRHPDIVSIFDASEDQGLAFIAMEFVGGHDLLRHTYPNNLLPVPTVLRTVARVATALAHAHSQGVVHRDIKPANVMIDPANDAVKVTDFGIARVADASRTRTGLVLGTPSFMSPEQMAGGRIDGRTDIYSLGVMLFQLLTGALPHRSESMATLMHQIVNDPAPDVRTLRPGLPEALANVVALAVEKRPELRYADGHQLAADLRAVAEMLDAAPRREPQAPTGPASPPTAFESTSKFSLVEPRHNADH